MVEILKSNWFVVLIAIIILSFVVYFVYDGNKYNVSGKSVDGHALLASVGTTDISADQLFQEQSKFDSSLLYQMYKIAVLNESIELTSDMKDQAKTLESTIRTNFQSQYGDDYEVTLNNQLAGYGFSGDNPLYDYCQVTQLEKAANQNYLNAHFDESAQALAEKSPRTISILSIGVEDANNLTADEQKKKDDIDAMIASDGFEKAVVSFSENTTADPKTGFFGYVDTDDLQPSQQQASAIDPSVVQAAIDLEKGAVSDWITVTDNYGMTTLYKVLVNETDVKTMYDNGEDSLKDDILFAIMNADTKFAYNVIEELAQKLDVKFEDEKTQEKIESFIKNAIGEDEEVNE